ncbi:MAG: Lrp/AsnC family transcriptional regulator [Brooklawnia sp.]|uniref:Lrp/AsnC family transcriptional regulator n=1 Tax=Brooklawnia sp. TaxID=2699740 RepID=UPI003C72EB38
MAEASVWRPRALSQTEESALRAWPPRGEADAKLTREERAAVIELLSQDVRRPITELAERSGLSKRRVSDFLSAMTTSGDLVIRVDLARRLTPFPIFAYYFLTVHPSRVGQIAAQLGRMSETRMVARIVGRYNLAVTFWLRSLGDLQRLEEALDARLRDVVIEDRTLVTRTPKHVGHLLDDDSFATRGRVRVLPV